MALRAWTSGRGEVQQQSPSMDWACLVDSLMETVVIIISSDWLRKLAPRG